MRPMIPSMFAPLLLLLTVVVLHPAFGQSGTSSALAGSVVDSTGAAVAGASVSASDVNSKATRTGTTDATGRYLFSQLNPGTYEVSISATGFGVAQSTATPVPVGRTVTLNFTLIVGSASQSVEVTAQQRRKDREGFGAPHSLDQCRGHSDHLQRHGFRSQN